MKTRERTLKDLNARALDALVRELGPAGMVRFLRQFEGGRGDYTRDRHKWLAGVASAEVAKAIFRRQRERKAQAGRPGKSRGK